MLDDTELLRRFVQDSAEDDYAELVRRRIDLVYSIALRQVGGDRQLAEDVTQKVFTDLARKAAQLLRHASISGWLYRSAQFAASDVVRSERRRRDREQAVTLVENTFYEPSDEVDWEQVRPILDEAMGALSEDDRNVVAQRIFEAKSFAVIGTSLAISEDAARKRLDRALDRMRIALQRRGIVSTAGILGTVLGGQAGWAAPSGLTATVILGAVHAAGPSGSLLTLFMATKTTFIAGTVALLAIGFGLFEAAELKAARRDAIDAVRSYELQRSQSAQLEHQLRTLQERMSAAPTENHRTDPVAKVATNAGGSSDAQPAEKGISFQIRDYPELEMLNRKKEIAAARTQFDRLYSKLGLTTVQRDEFERRYGDRVLARKDLEEESRRAGLSASSADYQALLTRLDEPMKELLGPNGFQALQDFQKTQWQRAAIDSLAGLSYYTDTPLSLAQSDSLAATISANTPPVKLLATGDPIRPTIQWPQVLEQAAIYLDPAQLERLRNIVAKERADEQVTKYIRIVVNQITNNAKKSAAPAKP